MKVKQVVKSALSVLLSVSMVVGMIPAVQLTADAAVAVDDATTQANVTKVQSYMDTLLSSNTKDSYSAGGFTWDSTGASTSWKYYNGMMLDAYTLLGSELSNDAYYQYVQDFYDKGNLDTAGTLLTYEDDVLGSVAMGLPLFDLLETNTTSSSEGGTTTTPFTVTATYDQTQIAGTLGLDQISGAKTVQVYKPSDDANTTDDTFVNGVVMTEFNGNLYCQWQSSDLIEDSADTWVAYSVSADNGTSWSTPMEIATPADFAEINKTGFCSSGGWHVYDADGNGTDDTLVAYINFWPTDSEGNKIGGGYTYYRTSTDGTTWSALGQVTMSDGSAMAGVFEQDPHVLESGRIVNSAHFQNNTTAQTGLWINPIYTDNKDGVSGWKKASYTRMTWSEETNTNSREMEPSLFVNEDGSLVMIFRDQNNSYTVLAALSTDNGETWSTAVQTNLLDARQKQSAGNLPDGTAFIVNCPVNSTAKANRFPLTITLSADGKTFDKAYVLGLGSPDALGTIKHQAADVTDSSGTVTKEGASITKKRLGYHYPKSVVIGDYLYVAYAKNKEIAEYVQIPLSSISLNADDKYENAIQNIYTKLTNSELYTKLSNYGGNYVEKDASEIELADVYMTQRFLIDCANAISSNKLVLKDSSNSTISAATLYYDVYTSLKWIGDNLYNSENGLFCDGYNTTSGAVTGIYQAKDVGFYAMTLVDTIAMLPSSESTKKTELTTILQKLFDGMITYQDADTGMWKTDITSSSDMSFEGSSMMAYALLKAYDKGIVSDEKYSNAGLQAFNGTLANKTLSAPAQNTAAADETYASGVAPLAMASVYAVGLGWESVEVPNDEGKYCLATEMSTLNKNGYIITRYGLPSTTTTNNDHNNKFPLSLGSDKNSFGSVKILVENFSKTGDSPNAYYEGKIEGVEAENLWLIDENGHVYSKYSDGNHYYLNTDGTNISIGTNKETATEWKSESIENNDNRSLLYTGSSYYLKYGGDKSDTTASPYTISTTTDQIMLWTIVTSTKYYALSGKTSYTVVSGPNAITESEILQNAQILEKASASATETTNVAWTNENVTYTWDNALDPTTPGKYTMTVSCYGTELGKITVTVTGKKWTDVSNGTNYTLAKDMVVGEKYLICNWYEAIENYGTRNSTLLTRVDATTVGSASSGYTGVYDSSNADAITAEFSGIDANDLWQIDANRRIYNCVDGSAKYYLEMSAEGNVSVTTTESEGSIWKEIVVFENGSNNILLQDTTTGLYLCGSDSGYSGRSDGNNGYGKATLWARTDEVYAQLNGTLSYSVDSGTTEEFEQMAQVGATVSIQTVSSDGTVTSSTVDWEDPNVTCEWSSNANVHTMSVYYNGVLFGTITVTTKATLDNLSWLDITTYDNVYERVQTLDPGSPWWYVIAGSDATGEVDSLGASYYSDTKQWYTSNQTVTVAVAENTIDGTYTLTNVTDNNRWYVNSNSQLYAMVIPAGDTTSTITATGYLTNFNSNSDNFIKPSRFSRDGAVWSAEASTTTYADGSKISTEVTADDGTVTTKYLTYTNSVFSSGTTEGELVLYQKVPQLKTEVALSGDTVYTVPANTIYMSEAYLKTKAKLYLRETDEQGNVTTSEISWSDKDPVTFAENVTITWADGKDIDDYKDTNGTYIMTVSYKGNEVGTITVNVKELANQYFPYDGWYYTTALGREPDFSTANLTVTYTDGSTEVITVANGLEIVNYDINVPGNQTAQVYYNGVKYADITVYVDPSPFYNVPEATNYPEYPEAGATRINKTATNDEFTWYDTGVTKVELDVAGISEKTAVDVILLTDISNSMGRYYEGTTTPGQKLDEAMDAAEELADILLANNTIVDSATASAEELKKAASNNSISFVTFGGYDAQNAAANSTEYEYKENVDDTTSQKVGMLDATQTVFVFEQNVNSAKTSFGGTKFITRKAGATDLTNTYDIVQIMDNKGNYVRGNNLGGTNYDYAFAEAKEAVKDLKEAYANANNGASYDDSDRQIILMFMTDGAPTYYNNECVDNGDSGNYIWGSKVVYPYNAESYPKASETISEEDAITTTSNNWFIHASQTNAYAVELEAMVDEFYSIGFKLSEDKGVSKHCATWNQPDDFKTVLANLAGVNSVGKTEVEGVIIAEDSATLTDAYVDIANQLKYSGSYATVYDEIDGDFTLEMSEAIQNTDGTVLDLDASTDATETFAPVIQVNKYDLYTSGDVGKVVNNVIVTEDMIGERTGTYTVLETVSFKTVDGVLGAYSDIIDDGATNILTVSDDGTQKTIKGANFTYTYNNGWEYFDWYVGDISNVEYAFSYYVYLEGTNEDRDVNGAWRESGVYNTNESAKLDYIDIDGNHATKIFPVPQRPWGQAMTTIEYYLVNEKGEPVNHAGEVIPFANRIRVDVENETSRIREIPWGNSLTINGGAYVPTGYTMYNNEASATITVGVENQGNVTIDNGTIKPTDTSTVWVNPGTGTDTDGDGNVDTYNVAATRVAFGVVASTALKVESLFVKDQIVVDYGKAIQEDVLANEVKINELDSADYWAEVVGFRQYSTDTQYLEYVQTSPGSTTYNGDSGTFSLVTAGTKDFEQTTVYDSTGTEQTRLQYTLKDVRVQYQLREMFSEVEKVFVVIKVTNKYNHSNYFYLCQELDVYPATNIYYETDFATGVFTTAQSDGADDGEDVIVWSTETDSNKADDQVQNDGTIGQANHTYGYDSTYTDDKYNSDGSSLKVNGEGVNNTTASFTFTGTGFELISRTGAQHGTVRVRVYDEAGNRVKSISVLNKSESTWGELYQIPVLSIDIADVNDADGDGDTTELAYGTYKVEIGVFDDYYYPNTSTVDGHPMNRGNLFYFDAVRIHNPAGIEGITDATQIVHYNESLVAYKTDGEAYPEKTEVRDLLIGQNDFDPTTTVEGAIYIDRPENYLDNPTNTNVGQNVTSVSNYDKIGPNNEVYLAAGQSIAFVVDNIDASSIASIDVGAKNPDGKGAKLIAEIASDANGTNKAYLDGVQDSAGTGTGVSINSSTEQYYDLMSQVTNPIDSLKTLTSGGQAYVFITNASDAAGVLSITDLKVAYNAEPESVYTVVTTGEELLSYASACLYEEPSYDVTSADFESEKAAVFYSETLTVETSRNVTELDIVNEMGLPVYAEMTYEDHLGGVRVWTIEVQMLMLGEQTFTITGYCEDGTAGASMEATVNVEYKKGGLLQNAKDVWKTSYLY